MFADLITSTNVTEYKDTRNWKWVLILEIVENYLLHTSDRLAADNDKLVEALRSRFIEKLLEFYVPSKK